METLDEKRERISRELGRVFFLMAWLGMSKEEAIKRVSGDK